MQGLTVIHYDVFCALLRGDNSLVFSHHKEEMTDYRLLPEYISVCGLPGDRALRSALEECPDTSLDGTVSIFCSPEPPRLDQQGLFCAG